jgi:hypothetical protein
MMVASETTCAIVRQCARSIHDNHNVEAFESSTTMEMRPHQLLH